MNLKTKIGIVMLLLSAYEFGKAEAHLDNRKKMDESFQSGFRAGAANMQANVLRAYLNHPEDEP